VVNIPERFDHRVAEVTGKTTLAWDTSDNQPELNGVLVVVG